MRKIKAIFLLAVMSVMLSACGRVQKYDARIDYEEKINSYLKEQQFSGVVLVATKDGIIYEGKNGYCDKEEQEEIDLTTVFEAGSLTKQMTAAAILKMDAEGLLLIEDKVSEYFPECSFADDVTIRELMNMNSHIPDYMQDERISDIKSQEDVADLILSMEPEAEVTGYSNSNYYLLGLIIEQISGQSYADYMEENFFEKIGMLHTQMGCSDEEKSPAIAGTESYPYYLTYAAGGLCTNLYDLYQWELAYFRGKVLPEQYFSEVLASDGIYLYGLECEDGVYFHQGETMNFVSYMAYDTNSGMQIIVLSNKNEIEISNIVKEIMNLTEGYVK